MSEAEANALALAVLSDFGAETNWHPPIIRFGANSCKIYSEASDPAVRLQKSDIFFIDLGPVFEGHEADIGATFVVGDAPEHTNSLCCCCRDNFSTSGNALAKNWLSWRRALRFC